MKLSNLKFVPCFLIQFIHSLWVKKNYLESSEMGGNN